MFAPLDPVNEFRSTETLRPASRVIIAASKIPVIDVATRYTELGDALLPLINPALKEKKTALRTYRPLCSSSKAASRSTRNDTDRSENS